MCLSVNSENCEKKTEEEYVETPRHGIIVASLSTNTTLQLSQEQTMQGMLKGLAQTLEIM